MPQLLVGKTNAIRCGSGSVAILPPVPDFLGDWENDKIAVSHPQNCGVVIPSPEK